MKETKIYETQSPEETFEIGRKYGENAAPGDVFCLDGDLGVGKTVFTKGFAAGVGVKDVVSSPTFTILQSYEDGRIPLYHFDVYRIEDPSEMDEIGFDEFIYGGGVSLIEWAQLISDILPEHYTQVKIEKDAARGFDYRKITVIGV